MRRRSRGVWLSCFLVAATCAVACGGRLASDSIESAYDDAGVVDAAATDAGASRDATNDSSTDASRACHSLDAGSALDGSDGGLFRPAVALASLDGTAVRLAIGDVTGDGRSDVIITVGSNINGWRLLVFPQNSCGGLEAPTAYVPVLSDLEYIDIAIGDVTGDGRNDIVTTTESSLVVLPGNADGTLGASVNYDDNSANTTGYIQIGDFNHDGRNDVVLSRDTGELWLQQSDGTLERPQTFEFDNSLDIVSAGTGEFNGDGLEDIASVDTENLNIVRQAPGGGFASSDVYALSDGGLSRVAEHSAVGDFTGDGRDDVAIVFGSDPTLSVYAQTSTGGIGASIDYADPDYVDPFLNEYGYEAVVSAGDVNADGRIDFVQLQSVLTVFLQTSSGTFAASQSFSAPNTDRQHLAVGDVNGDGRGDVVTVTAPDAGTSDLLVMYNAR